MKVSMPHNVLTDAIQKASVSALTPEAQDEEIVKSIPTQSCIKIDATGDEISFESAVGRIASKHTVKVGKDGVQVDVPGKICIQSKWLLDNLLTTNGRDAIASIEIKYDPDYSDGDETGKIMPNGRCLLILSEENQQVFSWESETYSVSKFTKTPKYEGEEMAVVDAEVFYDAVTSVDFSIDPDDGNDVNSRISIRPDGSKLFFIATDAKRGTVFHVKIESPMTDRGVVLVDPSLLKRALEHLQGSVKLLVESDKLHLVLVCGDTSMRLAIPPEKISAAFPNVMGLVTEDHPVFFLIDREKLLLALANLEKTNSSRFFVSYNVGASHMVLEATDEDRGRKAVAQVGCEPSKQWLKESKRLALNVSYVQDIAKRLSSDWIRIGFSPNEKRICFDSDIDSNLVCVMARMKVD